MQSRQKRAKKTRGKVAHNPQFGVKYSFIEELDLVHCKCLQGFAGTLRGNESAGVSNLQGLQVTCNACKKF